MHRLADIIGFRLLAIAAGYEDGNDADSLRSDPLFKMALERLPSERDLCSQSTISRLENLPDTRALLRMGRAMVDLYCASFRQVPRRIVLDVDDTFDAVHGGQQLRLFNAHYDEYGFQPIVVFDGDGRFVAALLRPAKRPKGTEIRAFLRRLLRALRANWPNTEILLRADGHYACPEVLDWCEAVHPTARRAAQELWDKSVAADAEPDEEGKKDSPARKGGRGGAVDKSLHYRKSVYVTASVLLAEFEDSVLEAQTAASDFSISDLVAGDRPVTLYIVARPMDARRLRRVFTLILTQMIDFLTVDRALADDGRARRWTLLVTLDEFLQFRMPEAAEWIRYVREYGIRLLLLAQSLGEVEERYGKGLTANTRLVVFRPNSSDEAERISRMVGEAIEEVPTRSTSKGLLDLFPTVSRGVRVDRRLVLPMHAALEMDGNDLIVFGYGKPIRATCLHPYRDPAWKPLYGPPARGWTPRPEANRWFGQDAGRGAEPKPPRPIRSSRRKTIV